MPYRDPEKRRAYGRAWMKRNAQKAREAMRRWRQRHPEAHNAESRAFYARHKSRLASRIAEYHRKNPEVVRTKWQRYRGRRLRAPGTFTTEEWTALVAQYAGRCAYCGEEAELIVEHRIPLSRGGTNWIENIVPACRKCNARKHRMTESEFRARLGREAGMRPAATPSDPRAAFTPE